MMQSPCDLAARTVSVRAQRARSTHSDILLDFPRPRTPLSRTRAV
jgi:hypothetical protein